MLFHVISAQRQSILEKQAIQSDDGWTDTWAISSTIETVAEHFNKPDDTLENLKLAVIKKVKGPNKTTTGSRRIKIIFTVDCVKKGLNRDYLFMSDYM